MATPLTDVVTGIFSQFLTIMFIFMAGLLLLEFFIVKIKKFIIARSERKQSALRLVKGKTFSSFSTPTSSYREYIFNRRSVMTKTEKEFFLILLKAVPELYIFPQVSFLALLDPVGQSSLGKIQNKRVDFVVYDIKTDTYCVVELDDRSHNNKQSKDLERDLFFDSASIRSLRYKTNNKPSPEALREDILNALS